MKPFQKLKNVLFSSYILVALIPLTVLAFISLYLLSEYFRRDAHVKNSLLAELTAKEISVFVQGKISSLNILKEALNSLNEDDSRSINNLLQTTIENYPSFESIFVLNRQGHISNIAPFDSLFIGFDYSTSSYFTQTFNSSQIYSSRAFISPRTGQPTITVAVPYKNGVITGFINLSSLSSIIARITPGRNSYAAITDDNGTFIAHTDLNRVRQRETEENFSFMRNNYSGNDNFFWLNYNGKEVLTSIAFINKPDWTIIIYQDAEDALAAVKAIRLIILLGITLSLVIVLYTAFRRTNNVIMPVTRLIEKTKMVSAGDYSSKLEYAYYAEFNQLIDEFNLMIDNIQQREKHYSSLFYNSRTKMLLIDTSTQEIKDINPAAAEFFGLPYESIINRNIKDFDHSIIFRQETLNEWPAQNYIIRLNHNNTEKYLDVYASPLEGSDNNTLIYLIIHDITDRIIAERKIEEYKSHLEVLVAQRTNELTIVNQQLGTELERIRQTEEKLRDQLSFFTTVMNTIPVPIFIRDMNNRYSNCNKFFEQYIGKSRSQIIGQSLFDLIDEPYASTYARMDEQLLKDGNIQTYEYKFPVSPDKVRDVIFNKAVLVKADGEPAGIIGSFQDITEHKKMEADIQHALNSEKELNELKTRFISTTSHEFRTPLTAILSSADLLELYGRKWTEEKYNKHTSQIRRSVKYMTELLDDILIISRAESGKMVFNPATCNLREVCREIMEAVKVKAGEHHHLELVYSPEKDYFLLDEKLIRQILSNLLSNAIKYSPNGGTVKLITSNKYNELTIEVTDQGIGIPEDEQKNLMIPFYRTKNAAAIPGTGLGLSIVRKSAEVHGGKLFFESCLGKGSTFTVIIPV